MKLLQHTARTFLLYSIPILILASLGLYFTLRHLMREELDDCLRYVRTSIENNPDIFHEELNGQELLGDLIFLKPTSQISAKESFSDTSFYSPIEGEIEPFRKYAFSTTLGKDSYDVAVCRKRVENEDILMHVGGWTFGILCALVLILNFVNHTVSKNIWSPFYRTLQSIKNFSFDASSPHTQPANGIEEFDELNHELNQMTGKMLKDFVALKQFTENASHEIQTPLAIIQTKTELLCQEVTHETQLQHIDDIRTATSRLAAINQSLLLLARIENRQFTELKPVRVDEVVKAKMESLKPLLEGNQVDITQDIAPTEVIANPYLLESLVSNLMMNAIRHNIPQGSIEVKLTDGILSIRNTGHPLAQPPELLFERFKKDDRAGTSTGLGLAIVKEICHQHAWEVSYSADEKWHQLQVLFKSAKA